MKRQRSPSPPPVSSGSASYQNYGHSESKYLHTDPKYSAHTESSKFAHGDKYLAATFAGGKASHLYTAQHAQPAKFGKDI